MSHKNIENLVFSGGSTRSFAYIGAIEELEKRGILNKVTRFAGASAGSLFATLLALKYNAKEIAECQSVLDFSDLSKNFMFYSMYCIARYDGYGVHTTGHIKNGILNVLSKKGIDSEITLKDIYKLTGNDLVIVTCNLNREKPIYLHHAKYPDVKLIDALLSSISIPFMFRSEKHIFLEESDIPDYYIDGGLVDNYPLYVFNDIDALYTGSLEKVEKDRIPTSTLGLKLLSPGTRNDYDVFHERKDINSLGKYLVQIINTMMVQIERLTVSESYIKQTIPIHVQGIGFLNFDLTHDQIEYLIKIGKESVAKYLDNSG